MGKRVFALNDKVRYCIGLYEDLGEFNLLGSAFLL